MTLKVLWTPDGINLDQIGTKTLTDISDGDTPKIDMSIRMLSIDTPEKRPTARGLSKDEMRTLTPQVKTWIESGDSPVGEVLAAHLLPLLDRTDVADAHWAQGVEATEVHEEITQTRLTRPDGTKRALFVRVADERFDRYGRLLAYTAPSFSAEERRTMTRRERATFNFDMIENGWAASFIL